MTQPYRAMGGKPQLRPSAVIVSEAEGTCFSWPLQRPNHAIKQRIARPRAQRCLSFKKEFSGWKQMEPTIGLEPMTC